MGLAIFRASGDQGEVGQRNSVYLDTHEASTGIVNIAVAFTIRNEFDSPTFVIKRGFYDFPTNLGGATITAARLHLRSNFWFETDAGHSTLHIVEGVQHIPIIEDDYGAHRSKTISGGSRAYADRVIGGWGYLITLNGNGVGWLNSSGITKLCLRLAGDIDASEPNNDYNRIGFDWGGAHPAGSLEATEITGNSATLNAISRGHQSPAHLEITYEGDNPEYPRLRFEYGKKSDYGGTKQQTSWLYGTALFTSITADIAGLAAGTTYQWRVESVDDGDTVYTNLSEFTTSFSVTTNPATLITRTSATLNGTVYGEDVDCNFEWGLTTGYGETTTPETLGEPGDFSAIIVSLTPGITYHFRAKSTNNGITVYGDDATFRCPGYFAWII